MKPQQIVATLRGGLVDQILPRESSYIGLSISRLAAIRLRVGLEWLVQSSIYRRQMKERLESTRCLRSSATGIPAVVLATGPSLSEVDIAALEQVQALGGQVFALNFFNETNIALQVKPDYYVLADPVFLVDWESSRRIRRVWEYIQALETPTVFLPAHTDIKGLPESCDFRYFNGLGLDGWSKNISPLRARGFLGLTAYHAISIALFLGHDPVFTIGVDNDAFLSVGQEPNGTLRLAGRHAYTEEPGPIPGETTRSMPQLLEDYARHFADLELFPTDRLVNLATSSLITQYPQGNLRLWLKDSGKSGRGRNTS